MKSAVRKVITVVLAIVIFVLLLLMCSFLIEDVLLPKDFLFYENSPLCSLAMAPLLMLASLAIAYVIVFFISRRITGVENDFWHIISIFRGLGAKAVPLSIVFIMLIYVCFTNLCYVTADSIVKVSPINLDGEVYKYSDVEKIETGFGDSFFAIAEHKQEGSFYYKITLDGKESVFHVPTPNPNISRYEEDSYLELEEFDAALCELGIKKEASAEGYEDCGYDQIYIDRFLRIIEKKD